MSDAEHTPPGFEAGLEIRREVMGDDFVERAFDRARGTDSEALQEFVTEHAWGARCGPVPARPPQPQLLNIGMLIALRAENELRGHIRGALRNGLTRTEITEAVIHSAAYCGSPPAALAAMRVTQEVLEAELGPA